jgi:hypothetical protein
MAGFVQIVEYKTSRYEELAALGEKFRADREASGEGTPPGMMITTADRDRPGYYLSIIQFESYEAAMENSRRDDTSAFAAQMSELCDEPPKFYNLDVLDTFTR